MSSRGAWLLLALLTAACSATPGTTTGRAGTGGGAAGTSGSAGATAGTGGAAGAAGNSSAGTSGEAGTSGAAGAGAAGTGTAGTGPAGAGASGAAGGAAGAPAGAGGGAAGTGGASDGGVVDGGGLWGPNGPKKQWTCPAGPFGDQMLGASTTVCAGKTAFGWSEGPTWIASEGAFFFSNFPINQPTGGDILKVTPAGVCEVWLHDVGCNGLGVSPSGNLLAPCQTPRAIMEYDVKTKVGRKIATMADGKMFDSPNDLIARSDGNIYFSNRTAENGNRPVGLGEALVRIDPLGATSVIQKGALNGVALSPDETKLYVVGMGTWTLDAAGVPGMKGGPTPGGDGIAVDCAGRITNNGTNSAYGGPDGKLLLIVGGGAGARIATVTVPGLP
jgi:sugar lactone lactonase YvrE